jgi:hypothetical protein
MIPLLRYVFTPLHNGVMIGYQAAAMARHAERTIRRLAQEPDA